MAAPAIKQGGDPPKATHVADSAALVTMLGETRVRGNHTHSMAKYMATGKKWTCFIGESQQSDKSRHGSFGGVMLSARSYLSLKPVGGSQQMKVCWKMGPSAYYTGCYIYLRQCPVLLFCACFCFSFFNIYFFFKKMSLFFFNVKSNLI